VPSTGTTPPVEPDDREKKGETRNLEYQRRTKVEAGGIVL